MPAVIKCRECDAARRRGGDMDASVRQAPPVADIFDGYINDQEMAAKRGVTPRTLRDERQRRDGPPYVKDGRRVFYPIDGYRDWLRANEWRSARKSP
jgi:hypothetical protein